jgi:hypothetical protein
MAIPGSEYTLWTGVGADYIRDVTDFRKWGKLTNGLKKYIEQRIQDKNNGTYNNTISMAIPSTELITWDENQYLNTIDSFDTWRKKTNGLKKYLDDYFIADANTVKVFLHIEQKKGDDWTLRINQVMTPIPLDLSFQITYQLDSGSITTTSKFNASNYPNYTPLGTSLYSDGSTTKKNFKLRTIVVYYQNGLNPIKTFDINKNYYTGDSVDIQTTDNKFTVTNITGGTNTAVTYTELQNVLDELPSARTWFCITLTPLGLT